MNLKEANKEISKYPGFSLNKQNSFTTSMKNNNFNMDESDKIALNDYTYQAEDGNLEGLHNQNTFHFNVNLSNNEINLK